MPPPNWTEIRNTIFWRDPEPVAALTSTLLLLWGLWLACGWGTTVTLLYGVKDDVVGVYMALCGIGMLIGMLWDRHCLYGLAVMGGAIGWLYVALSGAVASDFHSATLPLYGGLALWTGWVWVRLHFDDARLGRKRELTWTGFRRP